jgi:PAS domain S-box-containing protein
MSQVPVSADVAAALGDPEFAREAAMRPSILISVGTLTVRWANEAALALFGAADPEQMTTRIAAGSEPGAKRFRQLAGLLRPDAPARTERLRFQIDGRFEALAWRIQRLPSDALLAASLVDSPIVPQPGDLQPGQDQLQETAGAAVTNASGAPASADGANPNAPARPPMGVRPLRFVWRTNAENRLSEVSAPFCATLGCRSEDLLGEDLGELADRLGVDPDRRLAGALASRATWADIRVLWPTADAMAAFPVRLGAAPAFGPDRTFGGWRGFGLIDVAAPQQPTRARQEDPPQDPQKSDETFTRSLQDAAGFAFASNVVALRRPQSSHSTPDEDAAGRNSSAGGDASAKAPERRPSLTNDEQLAFREIALALGARPATTEEQNPHTKPVPVALTQEGLRAVDGMPGKQEGAEETRGASTQTIVPVELGDPQPSSAEAFKELLELSSLGMFVQRGRDVLWANRAFLAIVGCEDLDQLQRSESLLSLTGAGPETFWREISAPTPSGEPILLEAVSHPIDWFGQIAALALVRRTAPGDRQRFLEAELRQRDAEARELHSILDTATDGVAVLDAEGRLISLNRAGEALFGCDQNQAVGEPFTALLAPESHAAALDYFQKVASNGVGSLLNDGQEIVGRARRGGAIPIFMTLGRANASGGAKFCAVLRDMTAWKKVEHELKEARSEAERASALKSDFLAKVSHEIRTPLNAILGFAEVIIDERFGPVGNERYRDYLKDIHASGTHVMSLVNDLLDLSKIEAGKMELNFDSVDANKIVSECVSIMQPQANSERVIVRLSTAPRLPHVMADERSLRQIVLNLLSNAVKFNEPGGQVIVSTALTDAGHAVIRIRDTGIGMSDTELVTALEPFRQVQTSRQTSGTGLGLPLTKALVEANRASFTVKSKKAEGTLVEVTFPPVRVMAE